MKSEETSHKEALKSTGIIGGAQVGSIIIGILKTKIIAILLGASGVGIIGIFQSITDLIRNATGLGINFSSVKDVAEANNSQDQSRIDRTITILYRWTYFSGILGLIVAVALCVPLSYYSFGDDSYALSIALLSITFLLISITSSQISILQGFRKVSDMAKTTLYSALMGTLTTIPLYLWLGTNGIVLSMILCSFEALFFSWYFSHKLKFKLIKISFIETFRGGLDMIKLGFFIVLSGFLTTATLYIVRSYISHNIGLAFVGYFQASWMISKSYVGIVLNAMLADYFPRLSAINKNNLSSNKMINEQLEVTLIIGVPMVIALLGFADIIIYILYSSSFNPAIELLYWQAAGLFFTLVSWPLGVMFLAKSKGIYSIINDSIWNLSFLLIIFSGWTTFGFKIIGFSFFIASFINLLTTIISVKRLGHFSFSKQNIHNIWYGILFIIITLLCLIFLPRPYYYYTISFVFIILLFFTYKKLSLILNFAKIKQSIFKSKNL